MDASLFLDILAFVTSVGLLMHAAYRARHQIRAFKSFVDTEKQRPFMDRMLRPNTLPTITHMLSIFRVVALWALIPSILLYLVIYFILTLAHGYA